jgi:hypothetical protein
MRSLRYGSKRNSTSRARRLGVHFVKLTVDAHRAVFAHGAFELGEKERLQVQAGLQVAQRAGGLGKTSLRTNPGRTMRAQMVNGLDPVGKLLIKFLQAVRPVIRQFQGALKALLEGVKAAFYLTFTPRAVRLGVQQPDP